MNHELHLTPAQSDRIADILRETRFKVMQARQDYVHQRHQLFWQGMNDVRSILTPEQQKIFDSEFSRPWEEEHHHHGHHEHGIEGMLGVEGAAPSASPQPSPAP